MILTPKKKYSWNIESCKYANSSRPSNRFPDYMSMRTAKIFRNRHHHHNQVHFISSFSFFSPHQHASVIFFGRTMHEKKNYYEIIIDEWLFNKKTISHLTLMRKQWISILFASRHVFIYSSSRTLAVISFSEFCTCYFFIWLRKFELISLISFRFEFESVLIARSVLTLEGIRRCCPWTFFDFLLCTDIVISNVVVLLWGCLVDI